MLNKRRITQEEYDMAIASAYRLGYQMGKIERQNRELINPMNELTFPEKQILVILQQRGFDKEGPWE